MPTPESQRVYHAKMETKGDVRVIDDGDVLVETIGPWQTWIGKPGEVEHSTKFSPPDRLLVTKSTAEHLVAGNAVKVMEEKPRRRKRKKPTEDKAKKASENKGAG